MSIIQRSTSFRPTRPGLAFALSASFALAGSAVAAGPDHGSWQARFQGTPATTPAAPAARAQRGPGDLQLFASLAEFQDATAGWDLAFEDFSFRPFNSVSPCYEPVNSDLGQPGTNFLSPVCFPPGELIRGFSIRSNLDTGAHGFGTMAFAPPTGGLNTVVVGAMSPGTVTLVDFDDGPVAVAMDAFDWQAGSPLVFHVLGKDGQPLGDFTLSGTVPAQGVFAGFISPQPVHRVEVRSLSGASQMVGNLRFGGESGGYRAVADAVHFGATAVNDNGVASMWLQQTGSLPVQLPALPAPAAPFSVLQDDCSGQMLAVGDQCQVSYGYAPTLTRADRQTLSLPPLDASGSDTPLLLTGRAVTPQLRVDTTVLAFGEVAIGQPASASVRLANYEAVALEVQSISAVSAPFTALALGDACPNPPFVLLPGEACDLGYQVTPVQPDPQRARVLISSNDPSSPRRLLLRVGIDDRLFGNGFEAVP